MSSVLDTGLGARLAAFGSIIARCACLHGSNTSTANTPKPGVNRASKEICEQPGRDIPTSIDRQRSPSRARETSTSTSSLAGVPS
jgi:hypothetical protein